MNGKIKDLTFIYNFLFRLTSLGGPVKAFHAESIMPSRVFTISELANLTELLKIR